MTSYIPHICVLALALSAAPLMAQPLACTAERAVWELRAEDSTVYRITLIPAGRAVTVASDLYMRLDTTQRRYWFQFSASTGYPTTRLAPVTDPYARTARGRNARPFTASHVDPSAYLFYALNADLDILDTPLASDTPAPPYLMVPELGHGLWYHLPAFTHAPDTARDTLPRGMFRLVRCLDRPHPPVPG